MKGIITNLDKLNWYDKEQLEKAKLEKHGYTFCKDKLPEYNCVCKIAYKDISHGFTECFATFTRADSNWEETSFRGASPWVYGYIMSNVVAWKEVTA